jgi:hypothetical protein
MAVFRPIKATALPADPAPHSVYFIKGGSDVRVKGYVTDASGTAFPLGIIDEDDVRSVKLDGFTVGSNTAINSDNSIFTAFRNTQAQLNSLSTAVAGGIKIPLPIDCSANPNYPPADAGDSYLVTVGGKIGGASGLLVQAGDKIIAQQTNAGGNQATVGSAWYIIQGNIDLATTTTSGITRIATDTETNAGSENFAYVTPSTLRGGVRNTTLTGYAVGANAALAATDTVLGAFGKVQGQLDGKQSTLTNPVTGTGTSGQVSYWNGATTQTGKAGFTFNDSNNLFTLLGGITLTNAQTIQTSTGNLTLATGAGNGNIILNPNGTGRVVIGTSNPDFGKLDVHGFVSMGSAPGNGRLYISTAGTVDGATSIQTRNLSVGTPLHFFSSINYFQSNVGIGTTTPARLLHVAGAIRITGTAAPATPAAGDQYFDSGSNRMRFRDGTDSWIDMGMFWESAAW